MVFSKVQRLASLDLRPARPRGALTLAACQTFTTRCTVPQCLYRPYLLPASGATDRNPQLQQ